MTSQEFADNVLNRRMPWQVDKVTTGADWTDSTKEQYLHFLTAEQANEMEQQNWLRNWQINNQYNTPRSQMERMIEAGINPAAAFQSVQPGNSSSQPADVHQPGVAAFHDTSDKLQRINTIMSGISSIMSTISQGVDAVAGIQGISYSAQNNWFDKFRADMWNNQVHPAGTAWIFDAAEAKHRDRPVEVAPGLYMEAPIMQAFPELVPQSGFAGGKYEQGEANVSIQQELAERRTRIDKLIQDIVKGMDNHASTQEMMNYFLQLFMYGAMSKFGGF